MKEKVDVSLDNRQIVSLFIAGLVVLGAVFVIGVVVGKKLSSTPSPTGSPDLLTALDQKAAQMEQARKDPPLTFQEELTRKAPDAHPAPVAAKTVVTADLKPAAASAHPESATTKAASAVLPELDGKVAQTPVPTRTAETEDLHSAFARIQQAAAQSPAGAFAVQVAASQSRPDAEAQLSRLKAKGYSPYIVTATVPGKGIWYRVRLGSFSSREEASRYLDDFRRETRLDAFVASAH